MCDDYDIVMTLYAAAVRALGQVLAELAELVEPQGEPHTHLVATGSGAVVKSCRRALCAGRAGAHETPLPGNPESGPLRAGACAGAYAQARMRASSPTEQDETGYV
jgi:hypothetical protein